MRKIGFLLLSLGFFTASCSSDDSNNNTTGNITNFLPQANGNYWVYDVAGENLGSGRDSLYIANDTVIGSNTYKKLKTKFLPNGFFSGALSNNAMRVAGDELIVSGEVTIPFSQDFPISISITDFTIFKEGASANAMLDQVDGTISQTYQNYPLDFDYTLTTTAKGDLATYSVNGHNYTNVKKVETALQLKISTTLDIQGFPLTITILPEQNVLTSTQYYAEGIGVVHVTSDFQYQLDETSPFTSQLPVPASASEHQEEVLDDYNVE
ncbi:hypothetical protein HYN59_12445 [Flavobacterium album]|uniref:Lipoprotein n=1 Tax=Flavobacterium album TaxID=2175091 RepID=A0A2S1QZL4_9FLAO|nr:hypothetical protein [Flavobacterium album]AWH85862.1 hypothetical protein HYN59_12445 [Flavobacterium album]